MTQSEFNEIIKSIIFTLSTDVCMDVIEGRNVDVLRAMLAEYPNYVDSLDLGGISIYGSDPDNWIDTSINKGIIALLGNKIRIEN